MSVSSLSACSSPYAEQLYESAKEVREGKILEGTTSSMLALDGAKAEFKVIQAKDEMLGTVLDLKA